MKKFINRPEDAVEEMLQGMHLIRPDLIRLTHRKVLVRGDIESVRDRQITLISGGGSGHEPAHAGYIGDGMLSAAVLGEIFTSPDTDSVLAAIKAVAGRPGTLLIVKNYTGDRMNFGLAAEMARSEGIPVEMIVVDDDVALREIGSATGARGLAGTVLIHKLLGAAVHDVKSLSELGAIGRSAIDSLSTMGVSFSAGTSPTVGKPSFELDENEIELGLGIHGERGVQRARMLPADELTEILLNEILRHASIGKDKRVAILLNNLGSTTEMELAVVARHVGRFLSARGISVERFYAGTFLSSLDMAGISLSMLGVTDTWLSWLDAPTSAPSWPRPLKQLSSKPNTRVTVEAVVPAATPSQSGEVLTQRGLNTRQAIQAACDALVAAEPELTELDRIAGDGDLGSSMKRAGEAVGRAVNSYPLEDLPGTLRALGHTLRQALGGSSGPLYGAFFMRCGNALAQSDSSNLKHWVEALEAGCRAITELGGAHPGDRTMLDALAPFVRSLKAADGVYSDAVLKSAVEESQKGADATSSMKPRLGRSSYLQDRVLGHPDPGAKAVAIWLHAISEALSQSGLQSAGSESPRSLRSHSSWADEDP
jgi:dihydroxyacetone kinase